ncbi:MAG: hypothetical protein R6X08_06475 [Desulfosalsimonadaceae bacterium]
MKSIAWVAVFSVLSVWLAKPDCLAASANLLAMANSREAAMNHVDFVFDRIPEFSVDQSGQRVRVRVENTDFSSSFQPLSREDALAPLIQVKARESGSDCVIDLYFRAVPKFVDVTIDRKYSRFSVNVVWVEKDRRRRPGVMGKQLGRLKPIEGGAAAERVISSEYKGDWLRFFREFQWPANVAPRLHFSLPPYPGPMLRGNAHFFPDEVKAAASAGHWQTAAARLRELLEASAGGMQAKYFRLFLAKCLLRENKVRAAAELLSSVQTEECKKPAGAWKVYLESFARAARGNYFQAARLLEVNREACLQHKFLAPWYRLLLAELELAVDSPENARSRLEAGAGVQAGALAPVYGLRRADALFAQGRPDVAYDIYKKPARNLQLLQQYPRSLSGWAGVLYRREMYGQAFRHYCLLADVLQDKQPRKQGLASYWAAMARLRSGQTDRARLALWDIEEKFEGMDAAYRARLKLMDMDRLGENAPELGAVLPQYRQIAENGTSRQVREEAFFKQLLACHLAGEKLRAAKLAGRFMEDFWAGELMPEARALLVEIFPEAAEALVSQEAYFEALTLVSRYRDLLAQANISYDFLFDLAKSYSNAGFLCQAAEAYKYILDFEQSREQKAAAYLPLIRLYHEQKKYDRVLRYGSEYLSLYPDGRDRADVTYYYADVLLQRGKLEGLAGLLDEKNRPGTAKLDYLAGKLFLRLGRHDLAEFYLTRASDEQRRGGHPKYRLKLGEMLFADQEYEKAVAVYRSLLDVPQFSAHAGCRLIQIYFETGRRQKALKLYQRLAEKEAEGRWLRLASETVKIEDMQ